MNRRSFLSAGALAFACTALPRAFRTVRTIAVRGHVPEGPFQPYWESLKSYQCPDWYRDAGNSDHGRTGARRCVPEDGDWYARKHVHSGNAAI